jgi:hypothetical protein
MVTKRDGTLEAFDVDKFNKSLAGKAKGLDDKHVNLSLITEKVTKGIYSGKYTEATPRDSQH